MEPSDYDPPRGPLLVLHADAHVVALDKPAGLLSVPGKGAHLADCLIERVRREFPTVLLVHRLDRDTSGVIVFALNALAQRHLNWQFEERTARKAYVARLWGETAEEGGVVDLPMRVDWPNRPRQMVAADGRPAVTRWQALARGGGETRARLTPETGRSHQLRVHMAAMGHPILGDPFYAEGPARDFPRLMLHSESLLIRHPDGGRPLEIVAPAPF